MRPRLVVFAKAPRMGAAKTRLAADIGKVAASRAYRAMTARVLRRVRDPRWETLVAASPDGWRDPLWAGLPVAGQGGGDLGARLARALAGPGPVCVIGTDCPDVGAGDIAAGFAALRGARLVLGPAADGGFWLIGARGGVAPELFSGVRWSSDHALADVEANARGAVARLRDLEDVDDGAAWARWRGRAGSGSGGAVEPRA